MPGMSSKQGGVINFLMDALVFVFFARAFSAINHQVLGRDIGRIVGTEEQGGARNILWRTHPVHGQGFCHTLGNVIGGFLVYTKRIANKGRVNATR